MRILLALLLVLGISNVASAEQMKVKSNMSYADTVAKLETDIKSFKLNIIAKIDHAAGAKMADLKLNPTIVYIFGNPAVGTQLMNENIAWAYELPLHLLVYQDDKGDVYYMYETKSDRAKTDKEREITKRMDGALKRLTTGK